MIDFAQRALLAGIGIAVMAGPLGSIMLWRRMAYFGDTLAHSTLLGLSLSLLFNVNLYYGLFAVSILVACLLALLTRQKWLASDAILGLLSHTILAFGLIIVTTIQGVRIDLLNYLYGDILSVNQQDILWIFITALLVLLTLWCLWRKILSVTIDSDLARTEGVPVEYSNWALIIMLALVFAVAIKLVGVLLITALLIIPASAARRLATSPESMALMASIIGMLAVSAGLFASLSWDWPTGPAIVVAASIVFILSLLTHRLIVRE